MVHPSYDLHGRARPSARDAVDQPMEGWAIERRRSLYHQQLVRTEERVDVLRQAMDDDDHRCRCLAREPAGGWIDPTVWSSPGAQA
jgi:hypothetical protein